jgi:[ribosomal protein S5]-alanine N-acetyltransferase
MQSDFTTARLVLTSLTLADDEFIFTLVNSPGWLRFIGDRNVKSVGDASAYITNIHKNPAVTYWVVRLRHDKSPIGIVTLIKRDFLEFPDIGFAFLPSHTRSGFAFEATSVVLNYLSKNHLAERVLAITVPDNIASIGLLVKLRFGFKEEINNDGQNRLVYEFLIG